MDLRRALRGERSGGGGAPSPPASRRASGWRSSPTAARRSPPPSSAPSRREECAWCSTRPTRRAAWSTSWSWRRRARCWPWPRRDRCRPSSRRPCDRAGCDIRLTLPAARAGEPWAERELPAAPLVATGPAPRVKVGPRSPAVVGFTSGSTGRPKAVLGAHGSLSHFLPVWQERFGHRARRPHDDALRPVARPLAARPLPCRWPWARRSWSPTPSASESRVIWPPGRGRRASPSRISPRRWRSSSPRRPPAGRCPRSRPCARCSWSARRSRRRDVARLAALAPRVRVINLYGATETQRAVGVPRGGGGRAARGDPARPWHGGCPAPGPNADRRAGRRGGGGRDRLAQPAPRPGLPGRRRGHRAPLRRQPVERSRGRPPLPDRRPRPLPARRRSRRSPAAPTSRSRCAASAWSSKRWRPRSPGSPGVAQVVVVARDDGALGTRLAAYVVPAARRGRRPRPELRLRAADRGCPTTWCPRRSCRSRRCRGPRPASSTAAPCLSRAGEGAGNAAVEPPSPLENAPRRDLAQAAASRSGRAGGRLLRPRRALAASPP